MDLVCLKVVEGQKLSVGDRGRRWGGSDVSRVVV
jgi:hypothetical protein